MIAKYKPFLFFLISTVTFILACDQVDNSKKVNNSETKLLSKGLLSLDTFSVFPPEIDGCSCYFSNSETEFKDNKYIYLNDFASISFLKINGVITKFKQVSFEIKSGSVTVAKYKNENYDMVIEVIDGKQSGEETSIKTGTIKLTNKKGETISRTFFGECGC
ncbi:MAG: hypothetical protein ABI581_11195 [Sediminibacterium sp.]